MHLLFLDLWMPSTTALLLSALLGIPPGHKQVKSSMPSLKMLPRSHTDFFLSSRRDISFRMISLTRLLFTCSAPLQALMSCLSAEAGPPWAMLLAPGSERNALREVGQHSVLHCPAQEQHQPPRQRRHIDHRLSAYLRLLDARRQVSLPAPTHACCCQ